MAKWKIPQLLEARKISVYKLVQATEGQLSRTGLYQLARGDGTAVRLETLDVVAGALERLTGQPVTVADLLELEPSPAPVPTTTEPARGLEPDPEPVPDPEPDNLEALLAEAVRTARVTPARGRVQLRREPIPLKPHHGPTIAEMLAEDRA